MQGPAAFRPREHLTVSVASDVSILQYKTGAITPKEYLMKSTGNKLQQKEGPGKTKTRSFCSDNIILTKTREGTG